MPAVSSMTEGQIAHALATQTFARRFVALVDRCNWTGHEADLLCITQQLRLVDVEIKTSRADLKADSSKAKWWYQRPWYGPSFARPALDHRPHPPKVWKHYYAMPEEIWHDDLLEQLGSTSSGVILVKMSRHDTLRAVCIRQARPARDAYRLTEADVINIARLANLRMWNAYAARDGARKALQARADTAVAEQP